MPSQLSGRSRPVASFLQRLKESGPVLEAARLADAAKTRSLRAGQLFADRTVTPLTKDLVSLTHATGNTASELFRGRPLSDRARTRVNAGIDRINANTQRALSGLDTDDTDSTLAERALETVPSALAWGGGAYYSSRGVGRAAYSTARTLGRLADRGLATRGVSAAFPVSTTARHWMRSANPHVKELLTRARLNFTMPQSRPFHKVRIRPTTIRNPVLRGLVQGGLNASRYLTGNRTMARGAVRLANRAPLLAVLGAHGLRAAQNPADAATAGNAVTTLRNVMGSASLVHPLVYGTRTITAMSPNTNQSVRDTIGRDLIGPLFARGLSTDTAREQAVHAINEAPNLDYAHFQKQWPKLFKGLRNPIARALAMRGANYGVNSNPMSTLNFRPSKSITPGSIISAGMRSEESTKALRSNILQHKDTKDAIYRHAQPLLAGLADEVEKRMPAKMPIPRDTLDQAARDMLTLAINKGAEGAFGEKTTPEYVSKEEQAILGRLADLPDPLLREMWGLIQERMRSGVKFRIGKLPIELDIDFGRLRK
jgi:hypothetical protein